MLKLPVVILSASALAGTIAACGGSSGYSGGQAGSGSSAVTTSASRPTSGYGAPPATQTTAAQPAPATGAPQGAETLNLSASSSGALMFSSTSLHAHSGKVTIQFTNGAPEGHNLTLQSSSGKILAATPTFTGGAKSLTANLAPGTYTFYCSVPGHRSGGMQGTLTVS